MTLHEQRVEISILATDCSKIGTKVLTTESKDRFLSTWIERPKNTTVLPPMKSAMNFGFDKKDVRDRVSNEFIGSLMCL